MIDLFTLIVLVIYDVGIVTYDVVIIYVYCIEYVIKEWETISALTDPLRKITRQSIT